jgi:ATP-dependent protease ClpP protease subunit
MPRRIPTEEFYAVEAVHTWNIDIASRELYIVGESDSIENEDSEPGVEYLMASRIIKNLRILSNYSQDPIVIHMKTCGGYWEEGMAMYDAIHQCECHVTILNYTHARSMSSIILQAADHRVMMPHSHFMFHYGTYGIDGDYQMAVSNMDKTKHDNNVMMDLYAKVLFESGKEMWEGLSEKQIKNRLERMVDKKRDVYLEAEEAVEWGFADAVFDGDWGKLKDR